MDLADAAQVLEEAERERALAQMRHRTNGSGTASAFRCAACEDEIPHARRQLLPGVQLCTPCARDVERYGHVKGESMAGAAS